MQANKMNNKQTNQCLIFKEKKMFKKTLKMALPLYFTLILSIMSIMVSTVLADFENTYTGYLDASNTNDDYQVTLPSDGQLQIKIDADSRLGSVDCYIYSSNGITKIVATYFGNGLIRTFGLKAGTYKIYLYKSENSYYYGNYIMKTNYYEQAIANDTEPNDRYNYATAIPANGTANGHLGYKGEDGIRDDVDWWKVTLASTGEIKINLKFDSTLNPHDLKIFGSDGITEIKSWWVDNNNANYSTGQLNSGSYYIYLDSYDYTDDYGGYIMQVTTPSSCSYSLGSSSASFGSSGGTGTVSVTSSSSSCAWTAQSSSTWIAINSGTGGTGNGTVGYIVSANTSTSSRSGLITIAGQNFTVTQSGAASQYSLAVTKSGTGSGTVSATGISCGTDCSEIYNSGTVVSLTASASTGSIFAGWNGDCTGTGSCDLTMNSNKSVTATFNLSSCTYSLSSASASLSASGGTGSVTVTGSPSGCTGNWTVSSNASWIGITYVGSSSVSYSVSENTSIMVIYGKNHRIGHCIQQLILTHRMIAVARFYQ